MTCVGVAEAIHRPAGHDHRLQRSRPAGVDRMDSRLVRLVRDDRDPDSVEADQTLVLPGAANFVATTSGVATVEQP